MYSLGLLVFVTVASLIALQNWRVGLVLCVVAGLLQDPVRKVTPGTPAYLVMGFVPIYAAMFISLFNQRAVLRGFFRDYPQSLTVAQLFFMSLAISSIQTLAYGTQALAAIGVGLTFYIGWIPAFFLGFYFLRESYRELERPLIIFGALTSVMLVGVPLEYLGVKFNEPWLGMVATTGEARRWYNDTQWVAMMSGFYRAPEIMAWHAATLVMISIYLLVRRPAFAPYWVVQAAWGLACVFLGGRRKMFFIVLIFGVLLLLLSESRRRGGVFFYLVFVSAIVFFMSFLFVDARYLETAESGLTGANARIASHAVTGPSWLFGVVGAFGFGVGTKSQGTQHLEAALADTPLIEGGFEKVLVELGIVGTLVLLLFGASMVRLVTLSFRRVWSAQMDSTPLAALAAFLLANAMAYLVAYQVYGDPLIGFFLGFAMGLVLSGSRLVRTAKAAASTASLPDAAGAARKGPVRLAGAAEILPE
jgi:hypothetical protein